MAFSFVFWSKTRGKNKALTSQGQNHRPELASILGFGKYEKAERQREGNGKYKSIRGYKDRDNGPHGKILYSSAFSHHHLATAIIIKAKSALLNNGVEFKL